MTDSNAHHLSWDAESLWEQLAPVLPGISVEVLARCESTNSLLIERARRAGGDPDAPVTQPGALDAPGRERGGATPHGRRGGDVDPCLLVAEQQTRGRGRLGRSWLAATGASLTFSLALPLVPGAWSGLSLAVGLALAEALDPSEPPGLQGGAPAAAVSGASGATGAVGASGAVGAAGMPAPRIALKWPNDLWLVEEASAVAAKLGGILIETVSVGRRRLCVVGIGLNVLPLPPTLADELAAAGSGHACLRMLDASATAPSVLARVAVPLARALLAFEREGFAPLVSRYAARDLLRGHEVTAALGAQPVTGPCEGVDAHGALLVRDAVDGRLHRIVSGEVSVRRSGSAATRERGAGTGESGDPGSDKSGGEG